MKNPHDDKSIALLKYVLAKKGIYPDRHYNIIMNEEDKIGDDVLVLRRHSSSWEIFNFERGKENLFATFYSINDAVRFFYWTLNASSTPSPYSFSEEFEKETGIVW
jgi:hypothetical protein